MLSVVCFEIWFRKWTNSTSRTEFSFFLSFFLSSFFFSVMRNTASTKINHQGTISYTEFVEGLSNLNDTDAYDPIEASRCRAIAKLTEFTEAELPDIPKTRGFSRLGVSFHQIGTIL